MKRRFLLVYDEELLGVRGLDVPVDVDHAGGPGEDVLHRLGQTLAAGGIGPIDLGDEGLQDGRTGRHLRDAMRAP